MYGNKLFGFIKLGDGLENRNYFLGQFYCQKFCNITQTDLSVTNALGLFCVHCQLIIGRFLLGVCCLFCHAILYMTASFQFLSLINEFPKVQ